jgi:hypothetical protein
LEYVPVRYRARCSAESDVRTLYTCLQSAGIVQQNNKSLVPCSKCFAPVTSFPARVVAAVVAKCCLYHFLDMIANAHHLWSFIRPRLSLV